MEQACSVVLQTTAVSDTGSPRTRSLELLTLTKPRNPGHSPQQRHIPHNRRHNPPTLNNRRNVHEPNPPISRFCSPRHVPRQTRLRPPRERKRSLPSTSRIEAGPRLVLYDHDGSRAYGERGEYGAVVWDAEFVLVDGSGEGGWGDVGESDFAVGS